MAEKDMIYNMADERDKRWLDFINSLEKKYKERLENLQVNFENRMNQIENLYREHLGLPRIRLGFLKEDNDQFGTENQTEK